MNAATLLHETGRSIWLDNITRALLDSGTLGRFIAENSVTGLTSNPTIFDKAFTGSSDYDDAMRVAAGRAPEEVFFHLAIDDLRRAAQLFRPRHDETDGVDGWVSLADGGDTDATIAKIAAAGIDIDALAAQLQKEGAESFVTSWTELLDRIASKSATGSGG
jgi:transaldolase